MVRPHMPLHFPGRYISALMLATDNQSAKSTVTLALIDWIANEPISDARMNVVPVLFRNISTKIGDVQYIDVGQ